MPTADGTITVTVCGVAVEFDCEFSYAYRPAEPLRRWAGGAICTAPEPASVELLDLRIQGDADSTPLRRLSLALLEALPDADCARIEQAILEDRCQEE
jgi:hypothetical protein